MPNPPRQSDDTPPRTSASEDAPESTQHPEPRQPDPRVGDVLSGRVSDEELDADTVAQLAAWFGAPASGSTAGAAGTAGMAGMDPSVVAGAALNTDVHAARERRQRVTEAVDPTFLAQLEAKVDRGDILISLSSPMTLSVERTLARFDFDVWNLRPDAEIREQERPEDIHDALKQRTPQAILRDLHRPAKAWQVILQSRHLGVDVAGKDRLQRIRKSIQTRYAVRISEEPIPARLIAEDMTELRTQLSAPWEDSYVPPENRRGPASMMPTAEDLKWFGNVGYDPDL